MFDIIKRYLEKIKSPVRSVKETLSSNLKPFISLILEPIKILNYLFSAIPILLLLILTIGLYFGLEWVLFILTILIFSISIMLIYDKKKSNYKAKIKETFKNAKRNIRMRSFKAWKVRQKFGRNIRSRAKILSLNKRSKNHTFVKKTTTAKLDPYYPILIPLYINDQLVNAEIDSGSGRSIISQSLMEKIYPNFLLNLPEINNKIKLWDVQGNTLPVLSNKLVPILVPNYGIVRTSLIIIDDSLDSFLIGRDFMQKTKMSLVYKDSKTLSVMYNKEQEFLQNRETIKLKPNQVKEIKFELSDKNEGVYKIINSNSKLLSTHDEVLLSKENKVKIKNIYDHDILYKKGKLKFMIAKIGSTDIINENNKDKSEYSNMDKSLDSLDWEDIDSIDTNQISTISSLKTRADEHFDKSWKTVEDIFKSIYKSRDLFNIMYSIAAGDYITMTRSIIGFFVNDLVPKIKSFYKMPSKNDITIGKIFNNYPPLIPVKRYLFQIIRKKPVLRILFNLAVAILCYFSLIVNIMLKYMFKIFNVKQNLIDLINN